MSTDTTTKPKVSVKVTGVKPNQVEKILVELVEMKDKMKDAKAVLKQFKIKSDQLSQLKRAHQDIKAQMEDEKKRIEDEHLEDSDYETARNDELTLKNEIKEKSAELRDTLAQINTDQDLSNYDYNVKGEMLKVQVERNVKVYINGSEQK